MAESINDIIVKHQSYLQRVVTHVGNEQLEIIDSLNSQLRGDLSEWLDNNEQYSLTMAQQKQVEVLQNKIKKSRGKAIESGYVKVQDDMLDLATREQTWLATGLESLGTNTLAVSSASALTKMVERTPFSGATIKQMYSKLAEDDTTRIVSAVQRGLSDGLTQTQIQQSVFGTKRLGYVDGILQVSRNAIMNTKTGTNAGVIRSAVNGVQNESKRMLYGANSDIVKEVEYMATLDFRTSTVCGSRDGNIYKIGTEPQLPSHINCRSTYSPVIEGFEDIQTERPYVTTDMTRKEREKMFREDAKDRGIKISTVRKEWTKKNVGRTSGKTDFNDFLKKNDDYAKKWLGKTKYALWQSGELKLSAFVDPMGVPYSVEQLYVVEKDAFKKLGLNKPN